MGFARPIRFAAALASTVIIGCAQHHDAPSPDVSLGESGKLIGEQMNAAAGNSVACAGDVNGDGQADILVGAPHDAEMASGAGAAYLFYGPIGDRDTLAEADAKLLGEASGDGAGTAVSGAGDVDGDGRDDLLVGAWHNDRRGANAGAAYVFYDAVRGTRSLAEADVVIMGQSAGDSAGFALSEAGDLDGDGYEDLVVAAFHAEAIRPEDGAAYVLYGPLEPGPLDLGDVSSRIIGERPGDHAGVSVAPAGDLDGDGHDDLLVGAPFNTEGGDEAGAAYVVHGPIRGASFLSDAAAKLIGEARGDEAGTSVAAAGDVDGDGLRDVLVGAPHSARAGKRAGAAYVVSGPIEGRISLGDADTVMRGASAQEEAGIALAGLPDADGDGLADVAVGAWGWDRGRGAGYLVHGVPPGEMSLAEADVRLTGERADDSAGVSLDGCDVDGDGLGDLLIGAWSDDEGGTNAGAVYLRRGAGRR